MSRSGRRAGTNPIPTWPYQRTDNRTVPGPQATVPICCKSSHWHRARRGMIGERELPRSRARSRHDSVLALSFNVLNPHFPRTVLSNDQHWLFCPGPGRLICLDSCSCECSASSSLIACGDAKAESGDFNHPASGSFGEIQYRLAR